MPIQTADQLVLAPLGAGDLIDRAIRLYRQHFLVLIRIAAPPVIVAAAGWILLTISFRRVFNSPDSGELGLYLLLALLSVVILISGYLFTLIVMGGAARTLVAHLLRNDPVSAKATYKAVGSRFWGLLGAACVVLVWIAISGAVALFAWYFAVIIVVLLGVFAASWVSASWLPLVVGLMTFLIVTTLALFVFFFIVGRVAYVSQVMLVEGKGVFEAFGRSFSLARGNVRRLMAMTLFTTFATNSALMILMIPLGWYGYLNGIDPINSAQWPAWYSIGYSVLGTLSSIMLTPVWVLGLSLLYIDERVRHEGYDIELMAARQLGELPDVNVASPFGPALSDEQALPQPPAPPRSIFNLG